MYTVIYDNGEYFVMTTTKKGISIKKFPTAKSAENNIKKRKKEQKNKLKFYDNINILETVNK